MRQHEKEETALFQIGWALVGLAALFYMFWRFSPLPALLPPMPCPVHSILRIYCPGCGGTRAVAALFRGQFLTSFISHPMVLYTAVIGGWFLISQSVERFSRHRIKIGLRYRDAYVWIALGIVVVNFIVKNILLIFFQIDLLADIRL